MNVNELSNAQLERLALLSEELGEAQAKVGKILRHGYESTNPLVDDGPTNREDLESELGDVLFAIRLAIEAKDIDGAAVSGAASRKAASVHRWLHYQDGDLLNIAETRPIDMDRIYDLSE